MNKNFFNKELYDKASIMRAIQDYSDIADINLSENDKYYICTFYNMKYDLEETEKEFANYLIDIQNSRGMQC